MATAADPGWVYALVDPRDGLVRYVGQTRASPQARLREHIEAWHIYPDRLRKKDVWISGLVAEGLLPTMRVLEQVERARLGEREQWWRTHIAQEQSMPYSAGWIGDSDPWVMSPDERRALRHQRREERQRRRHTTP